LKGRRRRSPPVRGAPRIIRTGKKQKMSKRILAAAAIALAMAAPARGTDVQVIAVHAADPGVRQQLGDVFGHIDYDGATGVARVEAGALARDRLAARGIGWQVDAARTAALRAFVDDGIAGLRAIPGYACYRTVEETFDTMAALAKAHPRLVEIVDIGDTWQAENGGDGYPVRVLRLGNRRPAAQPRPVFFALSSIHAREYTPAELMTRFAEQLLAGYGTDADATWLLDHNEFHLLLQANPDGRKRAEQNVLWRKNRNLTHCPQADDFPDSSWHPGVDLNRNFPVNWNIGGSSGFACDQTYRGPGASSEPETQAVVEYVRSIFPDRRPGDPATPSTPADADTQGLFLDMHSYTGLVLWPWGGPGVTGNNAAFVHLGRRLAWFNDYKPKQSVELYVTDGTTIDFAYGELGVPAFTFEIGTDFFQDCGTFQNTILPHNLASLRYAARVLHAPYQLPAGPEARDVAASQSTAVQGEIVEITATVDDTRSWNGEPGEEPDPPNEFHSIASAALHVNHLPWQSGSPLPMAAVDGAFDEPAEQVRVSVDTTDLEPGRHLLVVQGTDASGQAGPPSAVFLHVEANGDWIFRHDFES
jgi:carboxypeptidase T